MAGIPDHAWMPAGFTDFDAFYGSLPSPVVRRRPSLSGRARPTESFPMVPAGVPGRCSSHPRPSAAAVTVAPVRQPDSQRLASRKRKRRRSSSPGGGRREGRSRDRARSRSRAEKHSRRLARLQRRMSEPDLPVPALPDSSRLAAAQRFIPSSSTRPRSDICPTAVTIAAQRRPPAPGPLPFLYSARRLRSVAPAGDESTTTRNRLALYKKRVCLLFMISGMNTTLVAPGEVRGGCRRRSLQRAASSCSLPLSDHVRLSPSAVPPLRRSRPRSSRYRSDRARATTRSRRGGSNKGGGVFGRPRRQSISRRSVLRTCWMTWTYPRGTMACCGVGVRVKRGNRGCLNG